MKAIVQRVKRAKVSVDHETIGNIEHGLLIFLGVGQDDGRIEADLLWRKISKLRIFADQEGKTNLDLQAVQGNVLIISQFTLYGNCRKGNRPSFTESAPAALGKELYEYFLSLAEKDFPNYQHGEFGADMQVELLNDGPFTIILDTDQLKEKR